MKQKLWLRVIWMSAMLMIIMSTITSAVTMYAPDGRTAKVADADVSAWKKVGWYDSKTIKMYAMDGRTKEVPIAEIATRKKNGWYEKRTDVYTLLYSQDRRIIEVPKGKVKEYTAVGWSEKPVEFQITKMDSNHKFGNGILYVFGPSTISYSNSYKNRSDIKILYIYGSVNELDSFAFDSCSKLSRVELSDKVKTLEDYSFDDTSITRIGIPKTVTGISATVFDTQGFSSYSNSVNKKMVIYCEKGSAAETFAKKYNIKHVDATMIYCIDGRTMMVDKEEKRIYLSSGLWKENPLIKMYALDGRTTLVYRDAIEDWKKVGWYENKSDVITTMYALDGRKKEVYKANVAAEKAVGWYENKSDVMVKVFALDGRHKEIYKANIKAEKAVGWYLLDDYIATVINAYGYESALDALDKLYSEYVYSWSEPNVIDKSTYEKKYAEVINKYYKSVGCPVVVLTWKRGENSIGTPEITVTFRNVSSKTVIAFDQKFTCLDAYGNRTADYSWYNGDYTGYCTGENIKSGEKFSRTWTLYSNEQTYKITWPKMLKVAFSDGSTWYN